MNQRNSFNLYLARTAVMLSGARRVALLLLLTLLTTATAWAQTYTLESGTLTISGSGTIIEDDVKGACGNDKSLIKEVIIGAGVTGIDEYALADCSQLTSMTIGPDVTTIDYTAFWNCTKLTSVTIGSSLTPDNFDSENANGAFAGCVELAEFIVPAGHQSFTSVDGVLYCNEGKTLFQCPLGKTSCTIPDGVTTIADRAFAGTKITSLTMPNSVTTLGKNVFAGCQFTEVTLSNSITTCGDYIFLQCPNLKTVTIPEGVKTLGQEFTFSGCTSLESVTIPGSLTNIPVFAFAGCENLQSVTINDGLTKINRGAFNRCTSLKSVNIPNSVTTIGESAFYECQKLETLPIYNGVTTIDGYAFVDCTGLTSLVIPSSVTSIGYKAFYGCNNITTLTIGSGVKEIGGEVFKNWGDNVVVYCFADPSQLTWYCSSDFNANTTFHVYNADDWTTKFGDAKVQFVGDLFTLKGAYLPKTGKHAATIPSGVKTLKVYDDGGEDDLYSNICDGSFTLTAPTGYKLQVSGNLTVDTNDKLTVYDGADATADKLLDGVSSSSDGTATAITPVQSTGESLTINFTADADKRYSGLDLTVTVGHTITIASGITEGTITADKAFASDGETVTLTITPNAGYVLNTVSYNNTVITPVNGAYTFTMPAADVTITATWKIQTAISVQNASLELKVLDEVATGATLTNVVSSTAVTDENVTLTYTSSNSNVAKVEDGKIKALAEGTATITVSYAGNTQYAAAASSKTITVNVSKVPTIISIANASIELKVKETVATGATLSPAAAGTLTYTSSNESVAKVEDGIIKALAKGTATITVSFAGDDTYAAAESKTISVTVDWNENYEITLKSEYTSVPTVYAGVPNDMTVKVTNNSGLNAQNVAVTLLIGEEIIGTQIIASFAAGAEETLSFTDPTIRPITENTVNGNDNKNTVYTVSVEENNAVLNAADFSFVILYNGNLGKDYEYPCADPLLREFSFTGDVQVLTGDNYSTSRDLERNDVFSVDLSGTDVKVNQALLYVSYNWQNPNYGDHTTWTTTFNDITVIPEAHYCDQTNLGNYGNYRYGVVVYDVTGLVVNGENTFYLKKTESNVSVYPSSLIVMTDNPSSTPKAVYILEEADLLSKSNNKNKDAIYESSFNGIVGGQTASLYVFAAGAQAGEGDLEINGTTYTNVWSGTSSTFDTFTTSVDPGDISIKFISTGSTILALHQMVVVERVPTEVSVEKTTLELLVNDTYTIVPTTTPEGLAVTYTADGSGVVSVDEKGVVTALKDGTASIIVKAGGSGVYAESITVINVIVKVPTSISVANASLALNVLDEISTGATLSPAAAGTLTYTSSNESVAKVEGGNIKALAAGTATITVSFAGNDKYAAAESTISVTVSLYDASVSVDNNAFDLLVGETQAIAATTTPEDLAVTYTADGSGVVSVDENGKVTALKAGTGTVTVSVGGDGYYAASSTTVTVTVSSYEMANLFSGSNEWTSYVADRNLGVPAGLTAYIITALGAETATATEIAYIPQGEPVLLKRSDKTVNSYASYIYSGSASIPAGNLLKVASATSQPTAYKDFGLYQDAFVLIGSGTLAAGKVYLPAQQASQGRAASRTIVVDGQTTRIDDGPWSMDDGQTDEWYDLQGRRLYTVPTKKGVYIYNGKKVAIK